MPIFANFNFVRPWNRHAIQAVSNEIAPILITGQFLFRRRTPWALRSPREVASAVDFLHAD